jgi:hypothetical protein
MNDKVAITACYAECFVNALVCREQEGVNKKSDCRFFKFSQAGEVYTTPITVQKSSFIKTDDYGWKESNSTDNQRLFDTADDHRHIEFR